MTHTHCVFCRIVAGELPSTKLFEDERTLAFMDIHPITPGHALVIVKAHRENVFEMDEEECVAVMRTSKKLANAGTIGEGWRPARPTDSKRTCASWEWPARPTSLRLTSTWTR